MTPSTPVNAPHAYPPRGSPRHAEAAGDPSLLEILDVLLDKRWLIAAITALSIVTGLAHILIASPVYQANSMVQVEESKGEGATGNLLGETASLFEIRSPASAEMQILRSRLVVGQAVHNLQLDLEVSPKYIPVLGRWLARRATAPSDPGFIGMGGYVSGNESIAVAAFDVPEALTGELFRVRLTTQGFELLSPDGDLLGAGAFGEMMNFQVDGAPGRLLVTKAVGKAGAQFYLRRFFPLAVTEELQNNLNISEQGKQSGVIRASLEGEDPRRIADVLNEIGALYVRQNVERKAAEAEKSLSFLRTFLPELRLQLEQAETRFNQFRNRNSTFDLGAEGKLILEQSVKLQSSLLELQQKRKELRALYTAEHFSVQTLDAQIAGVNAEILGLNTRVKTLPNVEQELLSLTRDVKINNDLYVSLLNSSQQLRLVKEGKVGNVRIVDIAVAPRTPVKPQRALTLALAAVLGLLAGIGVALARNALRSGLKHPTDIEQRTGLHVYASVPHSEAQVRQARDAVNGVARAHVLALADPRDAAVESLRSLRTALQFAMLDAANNVILVSGPTPGTGKSFTSANLSAILGAADKKVLLIDADMRKGRLHKAFGVRCDKGLSEVLSGSVSLQEALHRQVAPQVDFLATGTLPPNPAELLMSSAVGTLLDAAAGAYDFIVVDTPPVLAASDAAILAPLAGVVFLVARAGVSTVGELQESAERLLDTGVRPKGVIFNDLEIARHRYAYGIGHRHRGYRYVNYKY